MDDCVLSSAALRPGALVWLLAPPASVQPAIAWPGIVMQALVGRCQLQLLGWYGGDAQHTAPNHELAGFAAAFAKYFDASAERRFEQALLLAIKLMCHQLAPQKFASARAGTIFPVVSDAGTAPICNRIRVPAVHARSLWLLHPTGRSTPPELVITPVSTTVSPIVHVMLVDNLISGHASAADNGDPDLQNEESAGCRFHVPREWLVEAPQCAGDALLSRGAFVSFKDASTDGVDVPISEDAAVDRDSRSQVGAGCSCIDTCALTNGHAESAPPRAAIESDIASNTGLATLGEQAPQQCQRNPHCVRGFKHCGRGGRCRVVIHSRDLASASDVLNSERLLLTDESGRPDEREGKSACADDKLEQSDCCGRSVHSSMPPPSSQASQQLLCAPSIGARTTVPSSWQEGVVQDIREVSRSSALDTMARSTSRWFLVHAIKSGAYGASSALITCVLMFDSYSQICLPGFDPTILTQRACACAPMGSQFGAQRACFGP